MIKGLGQIGGIVRRGEPSFSIPQKQIRREKPIVPVHIPAPKHTPAQPQADKSTIKAALKYAVARPGFKRRFREKISPVFTAQHTGDMKRSFTALPHLVKMAKVCPKQAYAVLKEAAQSPRSLYFNLIALACGNDAAHAAAMNAVKNLKGNETTVLYCLEHVVKFNTRGSRRLIEALFEHGKKLPPATRIKLFKQLAMTNGLAYKATLVECFGKIMENTTPLERNKMYASLLSWAEKWQPIGSSLRVNLAVVKECLRGQLSSCPIATNNIHRRAEATLGKPRSARW